MYDLAYFQNLYLKHDDRCGYETCEYEKQKYEHTLDAISSFSPKRILEIGCSIGLFTKQLANIAEHFKLVNYRYPKGLAASWLNHPNLLYFNTLNIIQNIKQNRG